MKPMERVGATAKWVGDHTPFVGKNAKLKREERNVEIKRAAEKSVDEKEKKTTAPASANIDLSQTKGEYVKEVHDAIIAALRRGQCRTDEANAPAVLLREVICREEFINAIATGAIPTPMEHDTVYAKHLVGKRQKLAAELTTAATNRKHVARALDAEEMDIIYSTLVRSPGTWTNAQWPANLPKPHDAFMAFMEDLALRDHDGNRADFTGNTLKFFVTTTTLTGGKAFTNASIASVDYVNGYVDEKSAKHIEKTAAAFHELATEAVITPMDDTCKTLGTPGLGQVGIDTTTLRGEYRNAEATLVTAEGNAKVATQKLETAKETAANAAAPAPAATDAPRTRSRATAKKATADPIADAQAKVTDAQNELDAAHAALGIAQQKFAASAQKCAPIFAAINEAEMLARTFREALLQADEASLDFAANITGKMGTKLENKGLTELCAQAKKVAGLMDVTQPDKETPTGEVPDKVQRIALALEMTGEKEVADALMKGGKQVAAKEKRKASLFDRNDEFGKKLDAFQTMIGEATLPPAVAKKFQTLAMAMRNRECTSGDVETFLGTMEENIHPLKKAIPLALEGLNETNCGNQRELSAADWIVVKLILEKSGGVVAVDRPPKAGMWTNLRRNTFDFIFNGDRWSGRGNMVMRMTGLDNDIEAVKGKNWFETTVEAGEAHHTKRRLKRLINENTGKDTIIPSAPWHMGRLAAKAYITAGLVAMFAQSTEYNNKFPWAHTHPFKHFLRSPLAWLSPAEHRSERIVRLIDDSYDNPAKLSGRGKEYYKNAYGMGRALEGEQAPEGTFAWLQSNPVNARLGWLKSHPDVLRFFQERTTLRADVAVKELDPGRHFNNPITSTTKNRYIAPACSSLGLVNDGLIEAYQPLARKDDGWKPGACVTCAIEMSFKPITDALVLNRLSSDAFVAQLMAAEKDGKKITYAYITNPENVAVWQQDRLLIPKTVADVVKLYKFGQLASADYLYSQPDVAGKLLQYCMRGEAKWLVKPENRDDFVALLKAKIAGQPLADTALAAAIIATGREGQQKGWIEDCTRDYERNQVKKEFATLKLQTETSIDILVAQQDVRDMVKRYSMPGTPYLINADMSDAFVRVLAKSKQDSTGGTLRDYDPFSQPTTDALKGAAATGYIYRTDELRSDAAQSAAPGASVDNQAAAAAFYTGTGSQSFTGFVDAMVEALCKDAGEEGKAMRSALAGRYGGDKERMKTAIKEEVYQMITRKDDVAVGTTKSWGIKVSDQGGQPSVEVVSRASLGKGLRSNIIGFVRN